MLSSFSVRMSSDSYQKWDGRSIFVFLQSSREENFIISD